MIWKARSRGRRLGIVALAAVVTDPGPIDDSPELAELETSATGLEERLEWALMGLGVRRRRQAVSPTWGA